MVTLTYCNNCLQLTKNKYLHLVIKKNMHTISSLIIDSWHGCRIRSTNSKRKILPVVPCISNTFQSEITHYFRTLINYWTWINLDYRAYTFQFTEYKWKPFLFFEIPKKDFLETTQYRRKFFSIMYNMYYQIIGFFPK